MQVHLLWQKKDLLPRPHLLVLQRDTSVRLINQVLSVSALGSTLNAELHPATTSCPLFLGWGTAEMYSTGWFGVDWDLLAVFSVAWLSSQSPEAEWGEEGAGSLCGVCWSPWAQQREAGIDHGHTWSKKLLGISAAVQILINCISERRTETYLPRKIIKGWRMVIWR